MYLLAVIVLICNRDTFRYCKFKCRLVHSLPCGICFSKVLITMTVTKLGIVLISVHSSSFLKFLPYSYEMEEQNLSNFQSSFLRHHFFRVLCLTSQDLSCLFCPWIVREMEKLPKKNSISWKDFSPQPLYQFFFIFSPSFMLKSS